MKGFRVACRVLSAGDQHKRFPGLKRMISTTARFRLSVGAAVVLAGALSFGFERAVAVAADVDFAREIQPLLARRCFACHGPDTQEAGLRLDEAASATAELDSGMTAVVPGDAAASELLARIQSNDEAVQMPPEGSRLTAEEVAVIRRWIDDGAAWEKHWAFRPLARPEVPVGESVSPAANPPPPASPIDAFVRHGLAQQGLPVPERADKLTLLRRATYSVTGLPPNEAEVRDFLADESPDAWEKVVDRLLASPHYGEHWARHWLDLVRYAETNSFERDNPKPHVWRYRDYVIRSFNEDKPYDRFVTEQLAGDELPNHTPDAVIATGYYRLGLWDDEPADRLLATYDGLDDIVATTGQTFLGLTVNCARCHDHKIDPISQKDYYSLLSFFHNLTPMGNPNPNIERPIFASEIARQEYEEKAAELEERRHKAQQALSAVEQQVRRAWQQDRAGSTAGGDLDDLRFRFYRDTWEALPNFDELKPEDEGVAREGLFDITIAPSLRPEAFGYVFEGFLKVPADGDYTFVLDSDDGSRLSINGEVVLAYDGIHGEGQPQVATVTLPAGRLPIRLDYFQWKYGQGLSLSWSGPGVESRSLSVTAAAGNSTEGFDVAAVIKTDGARLLGKDGLADYRQKKKQLQELLQEQVPVDRALVVTERGAQAPDTYVFYRGNPHAEPTPESLVQPAFLEVLDPPQPEIVAPADGKSTGRRLALAKWITSAGNPLTARVIVNRLWQHHFGRGIVRSASNFGFAGDPPTHPELLDWLACQLIDAGWHLKPIHKQILMSEAFRASSAAVPDALAADPLNNSLWRFDMRRLAAEEIRDSIHVASGAFNPAMYGPSMYPEIPPAVMATQSRPGSGWGDSTPEERARRSVYAHVKRSLLVPILSDFDLADTDTTCPVRFVTTQPTQALGMMNGIFLQKQAKVFAERVKQDVGGPDAADEAAMVRRAIEIALVRPATEEEVARGVELIDTLEATDGVHPSRALEIYCLMVLNLNEFVYLD
jgi:mono/diheme cytochrome c family protein